jgi:sterol desaturase/sphingolipid hydroxylase (fatty acid hydroxylase superfamily)
MGAFAVVLALMALWEVLAPRRPQGIGRARRWPWNLGVVVIDAMVLWLVFPLTAVGVAVLATSRGFGLFPALAAPAWLAIPAAVLALDLAIYLQHVLFHAVPVLWRVHRMHHADLEFDVTTGVRFHPLEMVLSMAIKIAVIALLGAPAVAVLVFEVLLNVTSLFNHGNVHLPSHLERALRSMLVTPEMHRVHHSVIRRETDSNFGFNLSWWDRLFGTYRAQPAAGHEAMVIGLEQFREPEELRLDRMLAQPFRSSRAAPRAVSGSPSRRDT